MSHTIPALITALALLATGAGPRLVEAKARSSRLLNAELTILSFGSIDGELKDCGCRSHPKGGLAWRAPMVDSLEARGHSLLHLDAGNFAATEPNGVGELKTRFLWDVMEELGVRAITLGSREMDLWPTIQELSSSGRISVVCSNLRQVVDGMTRPVGEETKILDVNGIKVGIFALIGGEEFVAAKGETGIEWAMDDPRDVARAVIPVLQAQCDLIVLLSEMTTDETDRVVQEIPGIDVAIYGNRASYNEEVVFRGKTMSQSTGIRGQYAGILHMIVDPEGQIVDYVSDNRMVNDVFGTDEEMAHRVEEVEDEARAIDAEARAKQPAPPPATETPADAAPKVGG